VESCPICQEEPAVGVLCAACAARVPPAQALIPDHVSSTAPRDGAAAWLVDGFGAAHALAAGRTLVGRRPPATLLLLSASVSREHGELSSHDGWQVRDLGSRNGTYVDGQRVKARAPLADRAVIRFGDVALLFVERAIAMPPMELRSVATGHAADSGTFRVTLCGEARELCLVGARGDDVAVGGALLHRAPLDPQWREISLPPLEFQLLRALAAAAIEEADSPSRARGCVPTRQLARDLPFQSRYANEENVRQVVRRLRATLADIDAGDLVEAQPGRGYYLSWPVRTT
jgi:hypothetical protein